MNIRTASPVLRFVLGLVMLCGLMIGDFSPVSAGLQCYVKAGATPPGTGLSWGTAYPDLQSALGASSCTVVWVAAGTYKPTSGTDRAINFALKNGVSIYGGFTGSETQLNQRNISANLTILSGQIGAPEASDNTYHVVVANGTDNTAILDGFQIEGGYAANGFGGGGMWNLNSSASLANLIFSNNLASAGGGMYNENSSPSLTHVTFISNATDSPGNGAGMYNDNSSPVLRNVAFIGNATGSPGNGGGMYNNTSNSTLMNVTFTGNSSPNGGGMFNYQSSPVLTNVTFSGNNSPNGGGIYNYIGSNPMITNSILYGDTGGEIFNDSGSATVSFSIVQGGFPGTGNLIADPLLKPPGNYGGFTQTMALNAGSPAIDSGTNTGCPSTDQRGVARPQDGDGNGIAVCDMGATESRTLTVTFISKATQDGWVAEAGENSGEGGIKNEPSDMLLLGDLNQKSQILSILSFDTSSLPDNAVITQVMVKVKKAGQVGPVDPFTILGNVLLDVRKGVFSGNAALQVTDFQSAASKNAALTIKNPPVGGWYTGRMGAANYNYVNKRGITQFRLRFAKDDNNDLAANELKLYSGNASTAADRPGLIIRYYIP